MGVLPVTSRMIGSYSIDVPTRSTIMKLDQAPNTSGALPDAVTRPCCS